MPRGKLSQDLGRLDPAGPRYATDVVEHVLAQARAAEASDVHLHPGADGLEVRWRIDGVLQPVAVLPSRLAANVVARLKVLAELLTYRTDVPQEGRIRGAPGEVEMRLSTFPTLHGEKAVVRLFAGSGRFLRLADLGLPAEVHDALSQVLEETSGAGILSCPAGSGKTTSLYACLRELAARSRGERSLATLEDPIEAAVPGVAQSQVNLAAGLTLESGLRALLRQDPEVIAIGEIRDRTTAEIALQAALTGHLTLTTFHAGSACEVIGRLLDMSIGLTPSATASARWWPSGWCAGCAQPARCRRTSPLISSVFGSSEPAWPGAATPAARPATMAVWFWQNCCCSTRNPSARPSSPAATFTTWRKLPSRAG